MANKYKHDVVSRHVFKASLAMLIAALISGCNKSPSQIATKQITNEPSQDLSLTARQKWNLSTTVEAYKRVGITNAAWDSDVIEALKTFALTRGEPMDEARTPEQKIALACKRATKKGCNDPFIRELYIRFDPLLDEVTAEFAPSEYWRAALRLEESGYPPCRKFFACIETAERYYSLRTQIVSTNALTMIQLATQHLKELIVDTSMPEEDLYFAACDLLAIDHDLKQPLDSFEQEVLPLMKRRLENTMLEPLFRGVFYLDYAWQARGTKWASEVSDENFGLMHNRLGIAREAFEEAWRKSPNDPRPPTKMLSVMLLGATSDEEREQWFQRAMTNDPDNTEACLRKLKYLEPMWGGSAEELLNFGRECVTNKAWGPNVPRVMIPILEAVEMATVIHHDWSYYKRSDVWADIQAAYEELLLRNPGRFLYVREYADYAERCGYQELADKLRATIPHRQPLP